MSNAKLIEARKLINERRYAEARRVLREIGDHPHAQALLAKLNEFSSPAINPETPRSQTESQLTISMDNFEQWVNTEKVICWVTAIFLFGVVAYNLFVYTYLHSGVSLGLVDTFIAFTIACFCIWRVSSEERLRRYVTGLKRGNPYKQRLLALLCIFVGSIIAFWDLINNKYLTVIVVETTFWILIAVLWWWRSQKTMKFINNS